MFNFNFTIAPYINTIIAIVESGDLSQARLYVEAFPQINVELTDRQKKAVNRACSKWDAPPIF